MPTDHIMSRTERFNDRLITIASEALNDNLQIINEPDLLYSAPIQLTEIAIIFLTCLMCIVDHELFKKRGKRGSEKRKMNKSFS